ncbi:MAG: hypothetical protein AB2A00_31755 [Myxococcota bacterium]
MTTRVFDLMEEEIRNIVSQRAAFEEKYGKHAGAMLVHAPSLFRLFVRVTFDLELPSHARHLAGATAVYVSEPQDFLGRLGVEGYIDDLWLSYAALSRLVEAVGEQKLLKHWRSEHALSDVVSLALNVNVLEEVVPSRVLTLMQSYIGGAAS